MHHSGTALTASLMQAIGLPMPSDNTKVIETQDMLLKQLIERGFNLESNFEQAKDVVKTLLYRDHVNWLTNYLQPLFACTRTKLTIQDPRTSLLLPAWLAAAKRLKLQLKLVICIREPRDVCGALVWDEEPSAATGWTSSQRLWLEHYRAALLHGSDLPTQIALYEAWLKPTLAIAQLQNLAKFVAVQPSEDQLQAALSKMQPEKEQHGKRPLPPVHRSLCHLYSCLKKPRSTPAHWCRAMNQASQGMARQQFIAKTLMRARMLWLHTPLGEAQMGLGDLRSYRRAFQSELDQRLHPLLSPSHLNVERQRRGLQPLKSADELLSHLLDPDLLPMDPHPWFNCRDYQLRCNTVQTPGVHPLLTYLRRANKNLTNPWPHPHWLEQLGAARPTAELEPLPGFIKRLHPELVFSDPTIHLGQLKRFKYRVIRAHQSYWNDIVETFALWPADDTLGPLLWLNRQAGLEHLGTNKAAPARGLALWLLPGDWHAALIANLAGADLLHSRRFACLEALIEALDARQSKDPAVLLSLTPPLLAHLLARGMALPTGVAVLNLVWPSPGEQTAWLQLIAGATSVIECRPPVRAYLQGLGLNALWCPARPGKPPESSTQRCLLLACHEGPAETLLSQRAHELDPRRYSAILRLDAQLQNLEPNPKAVVDWLEGMRRSHDHWLWLDEPPGPEDVRAQAVLIWARQQGVPIKLAMENSQSANASNLKNADWLRPLLR